MDDRDSTEERLQFTVVHEDKKAPVPDGVPSEVGKPVCKYKPDSLISAFTECLTESVRLPL